MAGHAVCTCASCRLLRKQRHYFPFGLSSLRLGCLSMDVGLREDLRQEVWVHLRDSDAKRIPAVTQHRPHHIAWVDGHLARNEIE